MKWKYKNKTISSLEDMPEEVIGFVYIIENKLTSKIYLGKKSLFSTRKARISKREKTKTKTRKTFKRIVKESNWAIYTGSSDELNKDIKKLGSPNFTKTILEYAYNKKYLGFCEVEYQIKNDVLKKDTYNGNILSRYFKKDMENKPNKIK